MDYEMLLNIPGIEVLNLERNDAGELIFTVCSQLESAQCRQCGETITNRHGYREAIALRHTSICSSPVYLLFKLPRFRCPHCANRPTTTQQVNWYEQGRQLTNAYANHLILMSINSTVFDVACKEEVSYSMVERTLNRKIATTVNWEEFDSLPELGIDEISLKKGHKDFVTVVTARIGTKKKVITVLPDRKKETVKAFLNSIPPHLRQTVKTVCSDMYEGYINAAKEVFGTATKIVIDRFHVARLYRKCVDKLRKKELRKLKETLTNAVYKKLSGAMWAMRKKKEQLTEEEKTTLNHTFEHSPNLKQAYDLQNDLTDIFNQDLDKAEAEVHITQWMQEVRDSQLSCFDSFLLTLQRHWDEILNYFHQRERKNSGFVEGINNKIKTIKRRCYGIFKIDSLYRRIYLDLEGYAIYGRSINQQTTGILKEVIPLNGNGDQQL